MTENIDYREKLPDGCPPADAQEISNVVVVFRLVRSDPPTDEDFKSLRALRPLQKFGTPECVALGLSVHKDLKRCEKLASLPKFKGCFVAKLSLGPGAGKIKQTFSNSHHTWWPRCEYDITAICEVGGK